MNSRLLTLAAALFLSAPFTIWAQAPATEAAPDAARVEAAKKMLASMNMEKSMDDMISPVLDSQLQQLRRVGISDPAMQELKKEMTAFFTKHMSWSALEDDFVTIYARAFTVTEMEELTAFYSTPTGQSVLEKMPRLMVEGMQLGQKRVQANMAELQQAIQPIIEKDMAGRVPPPQN